MNDRSNASVPGPATARRRWPALALAGAAFLAGGGAGVLAGNGADALAHGFGGGHGWHGGHEGGPVDAGRAKARATERAAWVLGRVDASPAQEAEVRAIVERTVDQMLPLLEARRDDRRQLVAILTAPDVDTEALEVLRASTLAAMERGSQVLAASLAEVAGVLSAEQRRTLAESIARHAR